MPADPSDKVGPGRPPRRSRFQKGQSGNPKGRPKGSKNFGAVLGREMRKRVTITENGKTHRVTAQEVIARRLTHDSMKGTIRAIELLTRLLGSAEAELAKAGTTTDLPLPDKEALRRIKRRLDKLVRDEP